MGGPQPARYRTGIESNGPADAGPAETLALIRKGLKPATGKMLAEKDVEGLLTKLEDEDFEVSEKASKELAQAGRAIRPFLLKALRPLAKAP